MSEPKQLAPGVKAKRSIRDLITSDQAKAEIAKVLPKHLTPERMTRVALTAILKNPDLLKCTPESLMNALLVCSQAGLEPDGRLAHLIPFKDQVQVIFDYKGLVALALRNGAQAVYADKVCSNDSFEASVVNGEKRINHAPNWRGDRGAVVCYYAVCKRAGEVDFEVMTLEEVNAIRARSWAAHKGPWVTDFDEMAKKTVLRRMSKRWDLLPEIRDVINADDDTPQDIPKAHVFARPLFGDKPALENGLDLPENGTGAPGSGTGAPGSGTGAPAGEPGIVNYLRSLRDLCKGASLAEGRLLDYLAATGATDGSVGTLEDLVMSKPDLAKMVYDDWAKLLVALNAAAKGGTK